MTLKLAHSMAPLHGSQTDGAVVSPIHCCLQDEPTALRNSPVGIVGRDNTN